MEVPTLGTEDFGKTGRHREKVYLLYMYRDREMGKGKGKGNYLLGRLSF